MVEQADQGDVKNGKTPSELLANLYAISAEAEDPKMWAYAKGEIPARKFVYPESALIDARA